MILIGTDSNAILIVFAFFYLLIFLTGFIKNIRYRCVFRTGIYILHFFLIMIIYSNTPARFYQRAMEEVSQNLKIETPNVEIIESIETHLKQKDQCDALRLWLDLNRLFWDRYHEIEPTLQQSASPKDTSLSEEDAIKQYVEWKKKRNCKFQ